MVDATLTVDEAVVAIMRYAERIEGEAMPSPEEQERIIRDLLTDQGGRLRFLGGMSGPKARKGADLLSQQCAAILRWLKGRTTEGLLWARFLGRDTYDRAETFAVLLAELSGGSPQVHRWRRVLGLNETEGATR